MKKIVILGSTGSIGKSALDVIAKHTDKFKVVALTAGNNVELLSVQIRQFQPSIVAVANKKAYEDLLSLGVPKGVQVTHSKEGLRAVASLTDADFVLSAIVGSAGLLPTLNAVRLGKTIGLANKETLVMAGNIVMQEALRSGSTILPVDSEHSAIFQCLHGVQRNTVKKIILTASGGPFLGMSIDELQNVNVQMALKHPNWSMGKKITIDSATLMNKGLEVIEAHHLFGFTARQIDVVIHPQSIIHSMIELNDGSIIAQLSIPDMKAPIAYALSYPDRLHSVVEPIEWTNLHALTFQKPNIKAFPCLRLAYEALQCGYAMPCVVNAANEVAVEAFLSGVIGFNNIPILIEKAMEVMVKESSLNHVNDIEEIINIDMQTREFVKKEINK